MSLKIDLSRGISVLKRHLLARGQGRGRGRAWVGVGGHGIARLNLSDDTPRNIEGEGEGHEVSG